MKIKQTHCTFADAMQRRELINIPPKKPRLLWRTLVRLFSIPELKKVRFHFRSHGMERLGKREPCLILMNHSSFIDLKIASAIFYPRPLNIVCTTDGFVGRKTMMQSIGCIPAYKFINDVPLVRSMNTALKKLGCSVLMFPEATYSFDGTCAPLPDSLGKCLKLLSVPVVMVKTYGAFTLDPLYNGLQKRDVQVHADVSYLLSPEDIRKMNVRELNSLLGKEFRCDYFRWQQKNHITADEDFRADGLNRVLYKCPHCLTEGRMKGQGIFIRCGKCHKEYMLTDTGYLRATGGSTEFDHVPDWYKWQRDCVAREIAEGIYRLRVDVNIALMVNTREIYHVGEGTLVHDARGFTLEGCDGVLHYTQGPRNSYSLYADYFWYEIGDVICIGNREISYYCFPKDCSDIVAKTRLATEILFHAGGHSPAGSSPSSNPSST